MDSRARKFLEALEAWDGGPSDLWDREEWRNREDLTEASRELFSSLEDVEECTHVGDSLGSLYFELSFTDGDGEEDYVVVRVSNHPRKSSGGHPAPVWSFLTGADEAAIEQGLRIIAQEIAERKGSA